MMRFSNIFRTILLGPLSWVYGIVVFIRNILYDEHILPSTAVSVPTICVGNLAVGGTGKTPHIEYLIRLLSVQYKVAVLSRGYKRKTHGFVVADEQSTALTIGDEPMQIHRKFPDIAMAVCENRVYGIKRLLQARPDVQVVLLDDAFQHRSLKSGYSLLLTSYDNLYVNDHMLPLGRLRDNVRQVVRANAVVVTNCPNGLKPIDRRIVENALHLASFQHLFFSTIEYDKIEIEGNPLLLTGIAHPHHLLEHLRQRYPDIQLMAFADHHRFSERDIKQIVTKAEHHSAIITTEKDFERLLLCDLQTVLTKPIYVLPIMVKIDDKSLFDKQIMRYVSETLRSLK